MVSARDINGRAPRINPVIDPGSLPIRAGPDKTFGEVCFFGQGVGRFHFETTVEADIDIRLHEGMLLRGRLTGDIGEVPNVGVWGLFTAIEHDDRRRVDSGRFVPDFTLVVGFHILGRHRINDAVSGGLFLGGAPR